MAEKLCSLRKKGGGGGLESLVPRGKYFTGTLSATAEIKDINANGSNQVYQGVFFNISGLGVKRAKITLGTNSAFRCTAIKRDGTYAFITNGGYTDITGYDWIIGGGYTYGAGAYYSTVDLSTSAS